jgi:hypothetical protein
MPALPAQMTVIAIRAPGGPEKLVPEQRAVPQPAAGEVLVKVAAAGVNRPDVLQRQGLYPPPKGTTSPVLYSPARWSHSAPASSDGSPATRSWRW